MPEHRFRRIRRGRPTREPEAGERVQLSFRITPKLKRKLIKAGNQTGRSQSQEAETRIEWSFDRSDLLSEVLGLTYGKQVAGILMMLGSAMNHAGANALFVAAGGPLADDNVDLTSWIDNSNAYEQAKLAVAAVLDSLRPKGEVTESKGTSGVHVATDIIGTVRKKSTGKADKEGFKPSPIYTWDPAIVRSLLGPAILGRIREPQS